VNAGGDSRSVADPLTQACPPKPAFLRQRHDPPRLLTPLRRRVRHAYVRLVEQGWFGLTPLRTHVVICGFPRSGTTMLQLMFESAVADAKAFGRERSGLSVAKYTWPGRHSVFLSKKPDDVFFVSDIREYYRDLHTDVKFVLSVRDPRAVLTSRHVSKPGYTVPTEKWLAVDAHIAYQRQFADVILTEYRDAVERPRHVQERLVAFTGLPLKGNFDDFHKDVPDHFDTRALNGVRPIDKASLDKWRAPEHRERIQQILREIADLPERLVAGGYEPDTSWADDYR
jgi:hypothetical protein